MPTLGAESQQLKSKLDAFFGEMHRGPEGETKLRTKFSGVATKWSDVSRTQGSCWGKNITDVQLKLKDKDEILFIYASENFNEQIFNERASDCNVMWTEKTGERHPAKLNEVLANLSTVFPEHNLKDESFGSTPAMKDDNMTVAFQVIFAPVDAEGKAEFNLTAYSYNSTDAKPVNLNYVFHASGHSLSQQKGGKQLLGPDLWNAEKNKYEMGTFVAQLTGKSMEEAQTETEAEGEQLMSEGRSPLTLLGPEAACGKNNDLFFHLQLPVKQGAPAWVATAAQITTGRGVGYVEPGTNKVWSKEAQGFIVPMVYEQLCCTTTFGVAYVQPDGRAFIPGVGFKTVEDSIEAVGGLQTPGTAVMTSDGMGWKQVHNRTVYIPGKGQVPDPTAPESPAPLPRAGLYAAADDEEPRYNACASQYRSLSASAGPSPSPVYRSASAAEPMEVALGHVTVSTGAAIGDAIGVQATNLERNSDEHLRLTITLVAGLPQGKTPDRASLLQLAKRIKAIEDGLHGRSALMASGKTVGASSAAAAAGAQEVAAAFAAKKVPAPPTLAPKPAIQKPTPRAFPVRA